MLKRTFRRALVATALLCLADQAAMTQPANNVAGEVTALANANLSVNETYENWTTRCFEISSPGPCDVLMIANNEGSNQRLFLISIAYIPSSDVYYMQIVVPLGVAIGRGLTLAAGERSLNGVKYSRCERDGCYMELPVSAETIASLSQLGESTNITVVRYGDGEPASFPVQLNGFSAAIDRMVAEARQRAVGPAAP